PDIERPIRELKASLNLEWRCIDERIASHREIEGVASRHQPFRAEVENVPAAATQCGIEAEIKVRVSVAGVLNRSRNRIGNLSDAGGVKSEARRRQIVAIAVAQLQFDWQGSSTAHGLGRIVEQTQAVVSKNNCANCPKSVSEPQITIRS